MTAKLHPDTLPFLQELTMNNNRPWFNEHVVWRQQPTGKRNNETGQ
jgi:uncharacterized protein (DUF2461 family)